jgi:hypothetical protein
VIQYGQVTPRLSMTSLETSNRNWLATAKAQADLSRDAAALADRICRGTTRGADDMSELWRLVRLARELGA